MHVRLSCRSGLRPLRSWHSLRVRAVLGLLTAIRIATTLGPSEFAALLLWPQLTPGHSLFSHSAFFASLTGPPGVRHTSFVRQPPDLPSRLYVYPLGIGLDGNLTRRLALYQVSVRRLLDFATPASSPPGVATSSLRFATLGGKYPRPDFHRLDVRRARHTTQADIGWLRCPLLS